MTEIGTQVDTVDTVIILLLRLKQRPTVRKQNCNSHQSTVLATGPDLLP